jgi:Leucine-rich repeat (LRR) protein
MLNKLVLYLCLFGLTSAVNASDGVEYAPNELIVKLANETNYSDIVAIRKSVNEAFKKTIKPGETSSEPTDCATVTDIPVEECEALIVFYYSTNGDNWSTNEGWLKTNKVCDWYRVTCSDRHVSEIRLPLNELTGSIPTEIGNLTHLRVLDLFWNNLTGSIPTEFGKLIYLKELWLDSNQLTGSIPTELGNFTSLEWLSLSNNQFTGSIPTGLGNLIRLKVLWLFDNELTGSIPTELGKLTNLNALWLDGNQLTGSIPTELGKLTNLWHLGLYDNQLTGSIPSELGNFKYLGNLKLNSNQLTGSIPPELGNFKSLRELWLDSNQLTGSIPSELGKLTKLWYLDLYDNQLCGQIPVELKNLSNIPLPDQDVAYLRLDNNHLTASDPELVEWLNSRNPGWEETQTPCYQGGKLQLSSATYSVAENGGQATLTVTRTGSNDGAVSIDYATSDDTATAPDDYTQTSGTINWADGDDIDKPITVDIIDDRDLESDETFIVSLGNPSGGAELGDPDTASVTITDNDTVAFDCKKVTDISTKECKILVAFYDSTDGEYWRNNTGWKVTNSPCEWYGVDCHGGNVIGLALAENELEGKISKKLKGLNKLESLLLNDNKLSGKLSNSLMKLKKLTELDLNDNCLNTDVSKKLKKWLDELNPGWDDTQGDCLY